MTLPYDYYPAVLFALQKITEGATRTDACDQARIGIGTFEYYIERDTTLQGLLAVAERRGNDALADALLNIDCHKVYGRSDSKMAKVISDNIKWILERRDHKRFGSKQDINVNVTADKAITSALAAAKRRASIAVGTPLPIIDATFEEQLSPEEEAAMYR